MAQMVNSDVTLTLSNSEFSALNGVLAEVRDMKPEELTEAFRNAGLLLPVNHAETLVAMWDDLHMSAK